MAGYVGRLEPGQRLSTDYHFKGPWRSLERRSVNPGQAAEFNAEDVEYAIIVMSGAGSFKAGSASGGFTQGSTFTVGWHASLTLTASTVAELFITTLNVDPD